MSCENCKAGFNWDGTPVGTESELAGLPAYVSGDSSSAAVLFISDIYGWKLNNARLLADHFAKEANATVYVPDL
jgi:dienelactone hydrolase